MTHVTLHVVWCLLCLWCIVCYCRFMDESPVGFSFSIADC